MVYDIQVRLDDPMVPSGIIHDQIFEIYVLPILSLFTSASAPELEKSTLRKQPSYSLWPLISLADSFKFLSSPMCHAPFYVFS